ncbi:MAG: type II toxin-antitoxin system VapC family toxin [Actinomycetota bacterium]|nr:type II toxin-antitoxin system VapC family toxin [Actinomycetota bacterium]
MIVLDASAAVAVFLNLGSGASRIRERMAEEDDDLHVPHLFEVEVMNVLRRYSLSGALSQDRARLALSRLSTLRITRYPHTSLIERIWELRHNLTAYDATYIALAETLEAPLVTTDARLARASGIRAEVEIFGQ